MTDLTIGAKTTIADLRDLAGPEGKNLKGQTVNGKIVLHASKSGLGIRPRLFGGRFRETALRKQELGRQALGQVLTNRFGAKVADRIMTDIRPDFDGKRYLDTAMIDKAVGIGERLEAEIQEDLENRLVDLALPEPPGFAAVNNDLASRDRGPKIGKLASHPGGDVVKSLAALHKKAKTQHHAVRNAIRQPSRNSVLSQTRVYNRKQFKKLTDMLDFAHKHPERAKSDKADYAYLVQEATRRIEREGGTVDPQKMPEQRDGLDNFTAHGRSEIRRTVLAEFKSHETQVPDDLWARREVAIEAMVAHLRKPDEA